MTAKVTCMLQESYGHGGNLMYKPISILEVQTIHQVCVVFPLFPSKLFIDDLSTVPITGIPPFKSSLYASSLLQRAALAPVFINRKKSKEDFCFYGGKK